MSDMNNPDLIAVDGGGTACRLVLLHRGRRHEIDLGPANVASDRAGAIATVLRGLERLRGQAGLSPDQIAACHAHVGLAGVMNEDDAAAVADALPIDHLRVADDRLSNVTGALGDSDGAVIAVGTGSFVARRVGGDCRFVGGWGLTLGDEASGAWLGRSLLSDLLAALDGLAAQSDLMRAVLSEYGGDPARIVAFAGNAGAADFAALAPRIVEAAGQGDPGARRLMHRGAAYLVRALEVLNWRPEEGVCLIGGLGAHYARYLPAPIAASIREPAGTAIDGALTLAARIGMRA